MLNEFINWLNNKFFPIFPKRANTDKGINGEEVIETRSKLELRATELVIKIDKLFDAGGEYKRHAVYKQLIEEFPLQEKRTISYMIEKVIKDGII